MHIRPRRDADHAALEDLLSAARAADDRDPLSDHKYLALRRGDGRTLVGEEDGAIVAMAQVVPSGGDPAIELVVHPDRRSIGRATELLEAALAAVAPHSHARVWAFDPDEVDAVAGHGGEVLRRIAQLRRPLPPDREPAFPAGVTVRPFVVGRDEPALLQVNNEAFAGHPENGGWDTEVLAERMAQPWFDPQGLLLAWNGEGLAAFCWTKMHGAALGEIYVIAVADRAGGRGLGKAISRAGLWDLTKRRGATEAMLYAEVDNEAGRAMYRSLGFRVVRVDSCYLVPVP